MSHRSMRVINQNHLSLFPVHPPTPRTLYPPRHFCHKIATTFCVFQNIFRQVPPFRWLLCCRNGTQEQLSYTETLTSSNRQVNTSLLRNATVHVHSVVRAPVLDRMGISTEKNSYADSLL